MIRRAAARLLGGPLEIADPTGVADAIVILGAPLARDGTLSEVLRERVAAGHALYRAGAAPLVCVTGGPSRHLTEADVMADGLLELGVPAHALRIERVSRTTSENASKVAALLAADHVRSVWLVTQPFHLRRARYLFRRAGFAPLCHRIPDSLQDRDPARALRWIGREYASWARALL